MALPLLTEKQEGDLRNAIGEYLRARSFTKTLDAFSEEASYVGADEGAKYTGLLEKKWTSVLRLQRKILELEKKVGDLQQELATAPTSRSSAALKDWVPRQPRHILNKHRDQITAVTFHPVVSILATASQDCDIKIWDWETGDLERTLKAHTKLVSDVDFDSKGILLASCSNDSKIKIWDTTNEFSNTKTLHGHDHSVSSVRFLPGDDVLVSASRDATIKFWEVATGFCTRTFRGHSSWVRTCIPSDDGRFLVSCSDDHTARLWDIKSGETKSEYRGHENSVQAVAFAPVSTYPAIKELTGTVRTQEPGAFVVTGSRDKMIKLWDAASGQLLRDFSGHGDWVRSLVFHPNGKFLLSASDDKTIRVWDLASGRCLKTIDAHEHFITCAAWGRTSVKSISADGKGGEEDRRVNVMATGCADNTIRIWMP